MIKTRSADPVYNPAMVESATFSGENPIVLSHTVAYVTGGWQSPQYVNRTYGAANTYSYVPYTESFNQITDLGWDQDNDIDHTYSENWLNFNSSGCVFGLSRYPGPHIIRDTWSSASAYHYYHSQYPLSSSGPFGNNGRRYLTNVIFPTAASVQTLIDNSVIAMLPGIKPSLSILNSIYELKDFKHLPSLFLRIENYVRHMPRWLVKVKSKRSLKELTKLSADGYLTDQFAIRPLLQDIASAYAAATSYKKQLQKLLSRAGKRSTSHYVTDISLSGYDQASGHPLEEDSPSWSYGGYIPGNLIAHRSITSPEGAPSFRAAMEYTYSLSDEQMTHAEEYALLDSLGINLNPRVIWMAIPWSFVIDWFIGVGRWLDQFKRRNLEPVTIIHRYCWSVKYYRAAEVRLKFGNGEDNLLSSEVPIIRVSDRGYMRRRSEPAWATCITTSGMNLKEFSYAAALAAARQ